MVAKSLPQKQVLTKNFPKFFLQKIFMVANHFLNKRFEPKIFIKKFLVENFLWLQNHFLEKGC
jgi:hypothetical protein